MKYLFIFLIISFYLLSTFIFSFINISNYVSDSNEVELKKYILTNNLKRNIYIDLEKYIEKNLENFSNNFMIDDGNFQLSGTFNDNFILKILLKTIDSISTDFSTPSTMLYFYENSNEINIYFNKYLVNFGEYSFQKYFSEFSKKVNNKNKTTKEAVPNIFEDSAIIENTKESFSIKIKRLIEKSKSVDYFFFSSPLHFKLSVKHQDIPFIVMFRFNGIKWKISNIIINYQELIKLSNID